jgi:dienelactone hydrolase
MKRVDRCCVGLRAFATIGLAFHCAVAGDQPKPDTIHFVSGDVDLVGSVFKPATNVPRPGVVLINGSGNAPRGQLLEYAEHLCSLGVTALTYDKRGSGESSGDWTTASLDDLAKDAANAVAYLNKLPQVDPNRVGVWGVSQAGWIIPLLAARSPDLAFAIVVTGGGATPREIEMTSYQHILDDEQVTGQDRRDADTLLHRYFAWLGTGEGRTELLTTIEQARSKTWYSSISLDRILPSQELRPKWEWVATFDPVPLIKKMRMPVLVVLGAKDRMLPVDLSARRWRQGLIDGGNRKGKVIVLPDAGHGARVGEMHSLDNPIRPQYLAAVNAFVQEHVIAKQTGK